MSAILIYIIKSTLYLTLLYAFFLGVMRKTPFFRLNRWMLVVGTVVCMLLPFYSVSVEETGMVQMSMQSLNDFLAEDAVHLSVSEEVVVSAPLMDNAATEAENISFFTILSFLYMAGAVVCGWLTCRSISRMQKLIDAFLPMWKDGFWLVVVPDSIASFSWNRHMVISEEDYRHHPSVIIHEEAHLRKHHSWDLMLFSFVSIVHWFNPLVWIAKKELQQLHEYEADMEVIRQGMDATEYQLLLVKKAVGPKLYSMANSFNQDKLKNRIAMMHQEKTNSWGRLKWLMVVPVVSGAMFLFAQPEEIGNLASYKTYFQESIRKQDFSKVETGNVHSFNVGYDNRILFKDKEIASAKDTKRALAPMMEWIRTSSDKEMHCLGVSYESATDEKVLCSYLQEIKKAYEKENLTPLVFINEPSVFDAMGVKRYYGFEISFPDKKACPLRNFTLRELKDAIAQASSIVDDAGYVRIGFRATKDMKMHDVNEVRRMVKDLYHPQQVIFRQTVMKE